jgi:chondroitin AC lyase
MTDPDLQTLKQRMLAPLIDAPDARHARALLDNLSNDGTWPDVDYACQDPAYWKTVHHLYNLLVLARVYRSSGSPLSGDADLERGIFTALDHWLNNDFTNPNWWYNQIGAPGQLSQILLLLDEDAESRDSRENPASLTSARLGKGLEILRRAELGMTGQNLVWVADITARRALLEDNPELIQDAFQRIADEIRVSFEEGIQPDFSFHQHGDCLYSHGYGAGFAGDCSRIAALLAGTRFAFPQGKIDLLTALILDGHQWYARGIWQDFGAIGRELVRPGHTAAFLRQIVPHLLALPTGRKPELRALQSRLNDEEAAPLVGNRHFWCSDIMTHHRPSFYASARMYSDRLLNTDQPCNQEALKSHHIADGTTCLLRTGREYFDIFPVWDWQKIPGTTVALTPDMAGDLCRRGSRPFAGGVSNGVSGLAAFDFERDGLTARKCYLFLDDEFVCLGAGIDYPEEHPVITTVNQCHLQGEVTTPAGPLALGHHIFSELAWVHHDDVAYFFPTPSKVCLENEERTGSWQEISSYSSEGSAEHKVFTLWLDHGPQPANATYAYVVAPGMKRSAVQNGATPDIGILVNNPELQAARHRTQRVTGAAFYQPGSLEIELGWTISVDQPCLLLLRQGEDELSISLANPKNEELRLVVEVSQLLSGDGIETADADSQISFHLPGGMEAGQSQTRVLQICR